MTFVFDPRKATKCRTPAGQAQEVMENQSWVCWGAHMADKARHVLMKADGKVTWDPKKTMGDDFDAFEKEWGEVMKAKGLKNAKGGDGWYDGDAFHLELADSKISKTDERVKARLAEYVRLSREEKKGKGTKSQAPFRERPPQGFAAEGARVVAWGTWGTIEKISVEGLGERGRTFLDFYWQRGQPVAALLRWRQLDRDLPVRGDSARKRAAELKADAPSFRRLMQTPDVAAGSAGSCFWSCAREQRGECLRYSCR